MSVVTLQTRDDLRLFCTFACMDYDANLHIWRAVAADCPDAFATVMRSLAVAINSDSRLGTSQRIRQQIADKRMAAAKATAPVPGKMVRR